MIGPFELLMILGILTLVTWGVIRWARERR